MGWLFGGGALQLISKIPRSSPVRFVPRPSPPRWQPAPAACHSSQPARSPQLPLSRIGPDSFFPVQEFSYDFSGRPMWRLVPQSSNMNYSFDFVHVVKNPIFPHTNFPGWIKMFPRRNEAV